MLVLRKEDTAMLLKMSCFLLPIHLCCLPPAPGSFHVFHDFVVWLVLLEVLLEDDQTLIYTLYDYRRAKVYWSANILERCFSILTKEDLFKRQRPFNKISKSLTSGHEKPYFGSGLSK